MDDLRAKKMEIIQNSFHQIVREQNIRVSPILIDIKAIVLLEALEAVEAEDLARWVELNVHEAKREYHG